MFRPRAMRSCLTFASWLPYSAARAVLSRRMCATTATTAVPNDSPRLTLRAFAPATKRQRRVRQIVATEGVPPSRIAVVGGGLAGLALTYHLLHSTRRVAKKRGLDYNEIKVTVFDPARPGHGGATAVAAGLLHPFTPRVKKKAWHAKKAVPAALHLVEMAQPFSSTELLRRSGILRLALTERAQADYRSAAKRYPGEVEFWEPDIVAEKCAALPSDVPAAFLRHGVVVDTTGYTQALFKLLDSTGRVEWRWESVEEVYSLLGLDHNGEKSRNSETADAAFDAVILAAGASLKTIDGIGQIPITPCRGQNIKFSPKSEKSIVPPFPVISGKYIIPDFFSARQSGTVTDTAAEPDAPTAIIAGATFEYCPRDAIETEFVAQHSSDSDLRYAETHLSEPLHALVPAIDHFWSAREAVAGLRALPPRSRLGSIPIATRLQGVPGDRSAWVLTGLGSRGLLHHAYLGKLVAQAVVAGNEKLIPLDARRVSLTLGKYGEN